MVAAAAGSTVEKKLEIYTSSSMYHVELNPSDAGFYDVDVIQYLVKETARSQTLTGPSFKVLILNEVDHVTKKAQHALRRTMEKYAATCRIILLCNNLSRVIDAVRSRCLAIRVPAPTPTDTRAVLQKVAKKEGFKLPEELGGQMAMISEGNLRRAILILEATKANNQVLSPTSKVEIADWEIFVQRMAQDILQEQSPRRLLHLRSALYELLGACIPPEIVLKKLTQELMHKLDSQLKYETAEWAAYYEHRIQLGSKPIYHLEAFVAKFMALYRRFLVEMVNF